MHQLEVTHYHRPTGNPAKYMCGPVSVENYNFFRAHNAVLSSETLSTGQQVLYADIGSTLDDGETPDEAMSIIPVSLPFDEALDLLRLRVESLIHFNPPGGYRA